MRISLQNKKVTILGAARSGIAAANVVVSLGGIAKVSEFKPIDQVREQLKGLVKSSSIVVETGGHTQAFVEDSDYVVLSPGVRHDMPPVLWAKAKGIEVMGEIEFASRICPCPIVAVTGSNGKTTTVTLIADILKAAGKKACLCGNIGSPFSKHVLTLTPNDIVVLEVSSFQLESTTTFRPHVAVWTNFSQNHLDRHKDLDEYFQAKCRLFAHQTPEDFAVLNFTQAEHQDLAKHTKAQVRFFNAPSPDGESENPNFLAALEVVKVLGVDVALAKKVYASFKGVEHRLEFVRHLRGVDYINDSKSTTVEAGRWALERIKKPMLFICGGLDKHLDYSPLKPLVASKVKHMFAFGQSKDIMRQTFSNEVKVDTFDSLEAALHAAQRSAAPGDVVVLSPMCASFDMFKDYEHRGHRFKELVKQLT